MSDVGRKQLVNAIRQQLADGATLALGKEVKGATGTGQRHVEQVQAIYPELLLLYAVGIGIDRLAHGRTVVHGYKRQ